MRQELSRVEEEAGQLGAKADARWKAALERAREESRREGRAAAAAELGR